jgi:hypothetical protein
MKVTRMLVLPILLLALLAGVLVSPVPGVPTTNAAALGNNEFDVSDIVLDNPEVKGPARIVTQSALAEFQDLSMLMYRDNTTISVNGEGHIPLWLYFRNAATGESSHVQLPYFEDVIEPRSVEHVLTSPSDLWIYSYGQDRESFSNSTLRVDHFSLSGTAVPTSATLMSSHSFGNADSRHGRFIELKSGGLIAVWHQQSKKEDKSMDMGVAYRSPEGTWSTIYPVVIPNYKGGGATSPKGTAVQHPADDSIWVFNKRDSYHSIEAMHFTETGAGLRLDWLNEKYITEYVNDGVHSPEGESPHLVAVANASRNTILLAYQNKQTRIFSTSPFVKGAYVTLAEIGVDGSKSFINFPAYVERVSCLGLIVDDGTAWLSYRPIDGSAVLAGGRSFDDVYVSSYDFSEASWSQPLFLGAMFFAGSSNTLVPLAYGASRVDFATDINDGWVHYLSLWSQASLDDTAPAVAITSPIAGSFLSGAVDIAASAGDDVSVAGVEFYVDNALLDTDTTNDYQVPFDTTAVPDGTHTLQARAFDAAGNVGHSGPIAVIVDNAPPEVSITSPGDRATVSGNIVLSAAASDNNSVDRVDFYREGGVLLGTDTVEPYALEWDPSGVSDGQHTLSARAVDRAGNTASSAPITVLVDNIEDTAPPTVNITSPLGSAMVNRKSTTNIVAEAFDDAGVDKVEFYVDGVLVCVDPTAAYSCHWDVPAPPNRAYRLQARAYDGSAQVGFSPVVGVTSAR